MFKVDDIVRVHFSPEKTEWHESWLGYARVTYLRVDGQVGLETLHHGYCPVSFPPKVIRRVTKSELMAIALLGATKAYEAYKIRKG